MKKGGRGPIVRVMVITLIAGVLLSALAAQLQHRSNETHLRSTLASTAENLTRSIEARMQVYQYGLRGVRGVVLAAGEEEISRAKFQRYSLTRDIDHEFPGALGFGFIRRVPASEEAAFLQRARADGAPDFSIRQITPHSGDRYVIQYIEPVERNQRAIGLDIASESNRREGALSALHTGEPTLTAPIKLVQTPNQAHAAYLLLLPIYRDATTPSNESEREASLVGWSYTALQVDQVIGNLLTLKDLAQLTLWDITAPEHKQHIYESPDDGAPIVHTQRLERQLFGRRWLIEFNVHPAFVTMLHLTSPKFVFAMGCIVSLLLSVLSGIVSVYRRQKRQTETRVLELNASLERQVAQRTQELAQANRLLSGVLESASEMSVIATDRDGIITLFNKGSERMLGYQSADVIGKMTPASFHVAEEIVARGIELSTEYHTPIEGFRVFVHKPELAGSETREWTYVRKDGSRLPVSLTATVIRDEAGIVAGYLGIASDLTEFKQQRSELVAARDQMSLAAEIAELGVWSVDLDGYAMQWNDRMYEIYDLPKSLHGAGSGPAYWDQCLHPEDRDRARSSFMKEALEGHGIHATPYRIVTPAGQIRHIQSRAQAICDVSGKSTRVVGINRNITAQLELEASLRRAKDQADAASAAKSAFLASMSHEIRTPMNAVLGMLQLAQKTGLDTRQRDYIDNANSAARSLLDLLNDILDYSKIEADKLELERHSFELATLMHELAIVLSGSQTRADVEMVFDMAPTLPSVLIGDSLRLKQVLINLGGNALKFTAHGYVEVSIAELSRSDDRIKLRIAVTDTGIGISPVQQARIFEGFTQAETSTTRRFGGTGLGLVISQRLVALMGGTLQLESAPERGSRFWFDLELRIAPPSVPLTDPQAPARSPQLSGLRLLVVEDNALNRQVAAELLTGEGAQVQLAEGGLDGVAQVLSAQPPFDAVIMDIQMPDIDGLEATRRIRSDPRFRELPILAMTANASPADREQCLAAGMTEHIGKPIDLDDLVRVLMALRHQPSDATPTIAVDHEGSAETEALVSILHRFGGKKELFRTMLAQFKVEAADLLDELARQSAQANWVSATATLHTLKGNASTLGAKALARRIGDLQRAFKAADTATRPGLISASIIEELKQLLATGIVRLELASGPTDARSDRTQAEPLAAELWRSRLTELLRLLEASDMLAIEQVEALAAVTPRDQQAQFGQLFTQVQGLDFIAAAVTIRTLIKGE